MIKNKIIAVDFDGTLVEDKFPEIGKPKQNIINKCKELQKNNSLILWTCRHGTYLEEAVNFCEKQGLIFTAINDDCKRCIEKWKDDRSKKISAHYYIDDRAVNVNDFEKQF